MVGWLKNNIPVWLYLFVALYLIVRLSRDAVPFPYFIKNYFTDLLCMPVVLMLCLLGAKLIKRQAQLVLKFWLIILIAVEFIVIFEIILPKYSSRYTGDWVDGLMYIAGAVVFYFIQNSKQVKFSN